MRIYKARWVDQHDSVTGWITFEAVEGSNLVESAIEALQQKRGGMNGDYRIGRVRVLSGLEG